MRKIVLFGILAALIALSLGWIRPMHASAQASRPLGNVIVLPCDNARIEHADIVLHEVDWLVRTAGLGNVKVLSPRPYNLAGLANALRAMTGGNYNDRRAPVEVVRDNHIDSLVTVCNAQIVARNQTGGFFNIHVPIKVGSSGYGPTINTGGGYGSSVAEVTISILKVPAAPDLLYDQGEERSAKGTSTEWDYFSAYFPGATIYSNSQTEKDMMALRAAAIRALHSLQMMPNIPMPTTQMPFPPFPPSFPSVQK